MKKIRKKLKRIVQRLNLYYLYLGIRYYIVEYPHERIRQYRINHKIPQRYSWMEDYKDKYLGQRCFIIGNGPSLTEDDYIRLEDEYTFGANYICRWFEKTGIETNFFVVIDYWDRARYMSEDFDRIHKSLKLFSDHMIFKYGWKYDGEYGLIPTSLWNGNHRRDRWKISKDFFREGCYDGGTAAFYCIEIALFMGFRDIYLVGMDCSFSKEGFHAKGLGGKEDTEKNRISYLGGEDERLLSRSIEYFDLIKESSEKMHFKVYNATRGGKLELFERVDFDSILDKEKELS